jgi:hypothetical protein
MQCAVCYDKPVEVRHDACGHTFCQQCVDEWCHIGTETCPTRRAPIGRRPGSAALVVMRPVLRFIAMVLRVFAMYVIAQEAFYHTSRDMIIDLRHGQPVGPVSFLLSFAVYYALVPFRLCAQLIKIVVQTTLLADFASIWDAYRHVVDVACQPGTLGLKWGQALAHYARGEYMTSQIWNETLYYHAGGMAYLRTELCAEYTTIITVAFCVAGCLAARWAHRRLAAIHNQYCYSVL